MTQKIWVFIVSAIFSALPISAAVTGPYVPDADTLHLYHFDGNAEDAAAGDPIDLTAAHGATMTDGSYDGFGTALNTYEGSSDTDSDQPTAYVDEAAVSRFVGSDGAFTFEAIVKPAVAIDTIPNHMQIISGEDDGSYRGWQFRINTAGYMEFIKLTGTQENFTAEIPTTGEHAWAAGHWFHAAVTYNGQENTADNLTFYWTRLDSGAAEAAALASFSLMEDLWTFSWLSIDFAVGNDGRNAAGENFEGLVDEVRISSIARTSEQMLFAPGSPRPVILTQPVEATVRETQTACFQTVFASQTTPVATWFKEDPAGDVALSPSDPDITVEVDYDTGSEHYTAVLWIANTQISDAGAYYCRISNDSGLPRETESAALIVQGLTAHWTLDQADYTGDVLLDRVSSRQAAVAGVPVFAEGADGTAGGAIRITPQSGWAETEGFDPALGSGSMTISVWVNRQETAGTPQDLELTAIPNGSSLSVADGLKADRQWRHLCMVYSGSEAKLYLDGVLSAEGPWSLPAETDALLTIGSAAGGDEVFAGDLDDLRVYNYALSDTEVAGVYYEMTGQGVCLPAYTGPYDLTGPDGQPDCIVDLHDLAVFAGQWLSGYDFEQFADFSGQWMSTTFTPH